MNFTPKLTVNKNVTVLSTIKISNIDDMNIHECYKVECTHHV